MAPYVFQAYLLRSPGQLTLVTSGGVFVNESFARGPIEQLDRFLAVCGRA